MVSVFGKTLSALQKFLSVHCIFSKRKKIQQLINLVISSSPMPPSENFYHKPLSPLSLYLPKFFCFFYHLQEANKIIFDRLSGPDRVKRQFTLINVNDSFKVSIIRKMK